MSQDNATVRRWHLSNRLRDLRIAAGLTAEQVADRLKATGQGKWSRPKVSRIENQEHNVKTRELDQLLDIYGVTDQTLRAELTELAETAHQRGWLVDKNTPTHFRTFLKWEAALVAVRQFETLLIPGLLQTAEYIRALTTGMYPNLSEDEVQLRVTTRLARQQILTRDSPLHLHAILDEGLLERPAGTGRVMRNQLHRVLEAMELPNVTVQVVPKALGVSLALEGPFSILTMPEPMPDVVYADFPAVYIEEREDVRDCTLRFGVLTQLALSQADSAAMIAAAAERFDKS
ncbi:helix-turn-helix domain-containing protein [Actinokineospora inagensis]|uniref:helix-turn-helix domain-containing protein n=1 Tax=Actinokineospora inagensis TaxID=103730 RepID=UPI00047872E9|nr:helix-turn-helix transcriptional regulator [Actinokineospora inagensis]